MTALGTVDSHVMGLAQSKSGYDFAAAINRADMGFVKVFESAIGVERPIENGKVVVKDFSFARQIKRCWCIVVDEMVELNSLFIAQMNYVLGMTFSVSSLCHHDRIEISLIHSFVQTMGKILRAGDDRSAQSILSVSANVYPNITIAIKHTAHKVSEVEIGDWRHGQNEALSRNDTQGGEVVCHRNACEAHCVDASILPDTNRAIEGEYVSELFNQIAIFDAKGDTGSVNVTIRSQQTKRPSHRCRPFAEQSVIGRVGFALSGFAGNVIRLTFGSTRQAIFEQVMTQGSGENTNGLRDIVQAFILDPVATIKVIRCDLAGRIKVICHSKLSYSQLYHSYKAVSNA